MSEETPPPIAPLARTLFGWALAQKHFAPTAIALGGVGAALVLAEVVRGRSGLNLPYEDAPGFYGVLGVGVVAAALAITHVLRLALARLPRPDDAP